MWEEVPFGALGRGKNFLADEELAWEVCVRAGMGGVGGVWWIMCGLRVRKMGS